MQASDFLLDADDDARPTGQSQIVLYAFDEASGEQVAVGVIVRTTSGEVLSRWLHDLGRLRCAWGDQALVHLPLLMRTAHTLAQQGKALDLPQFATTPPRSVYGNPGEMLDELFARFVPLARPQHVHQAATGSSLSNLKLMKRVYGHLVDALQGEAELVIPQKPHITDVETQSDLYVPIQYIHHGRRKFATLVSAQSLQPHTIDRNVFPAAAELGAAGRLHGVQDLGVFVLRRSAEVADENRLTVIDKHFDHLIFVLKTQGFSVQPELSPEMMAASVANWCLPLRQRA